MIQDDEVRKIFVEDDLSNFEDFFDRDWFEELSILVENTVLEGNVGNFAVSWWGNARAFILPWLLVTSVSDVITVSAQAPLKMPAQLVWNEYLKLNEFNVALWKLSENVYCSIYFAYENLVVDVLKLILKIPIRVTRKREFKARLNDVYGNEGAHKIWHQPFVQSARETRNSIVHNGGKATDALLNVKPLPYYIQDNDVVISAAVTRELFKKLKPLVYEIVERSVEKIRT